MNQTTQNDPTEQTSEQNEAEVDAQVAGEQASAIADEVVDETEVQELEDGDATQEPIVDEVADDLPPVDPGDGTKVTEGDLENEILGTDFLNVGQAVGAISGHPLHNLTLCFLTLKNGYTVMGQSACVDSKNYRKDIGEQYARIDAVKKLWPLLGFRLADKLHST